MYRKRTHYRGGNHCHGKRVGCKGNIVFYVRDAKHGEDHAKDGKVVLAIGYIHDPDCAAEQHKCICTVYCNKYTHGLDCRAEKHSKDRDWTTHKDPEVILVTPNQSVEGILARRYGQAFVRIFCRRIGQAFVRIFKR